MIDRNSLIEYAAEYGIQMTDRQAEQFDSYASLLVEWNEKMNLTSIVEPQEIVIKHFLDSLMLLTVWNPSAEEKKRVIDVGTGAGFPGIPLKILRPDLDVTLLDSLNKRIVFLQTVSDALQLHLTCIHSRAEDGGKNPALREKFDLATARAVANLRELSEYCLPFVRLGGCFVAMKGGEVEEELENAKGAIRILGGKTALVEKRQLPMDNSRSLIVIEKISQTLPKYPRSPANIAKKPLI